MSEQQRQATSGGVAARIASAAVLIPITIAAVWAGGWAFASLTALVGVLMAWEWSRMAFRPQNVMLYSALISGAVVVSALAGHIGLLPIYILSALVFWAAAVMLALHHRDGGVRWAVLGVPYVCLPVFALIALRADPVYGLGSVIWLLVVIWSTDTAAFFAGRSIGGPKLAPRFSPKKTWSGAIAGVLAAAVAGAVFAVLTALPGWLVLAGVSAFVSVVGQVGDLIESAFKRRFGVKDSSNLIPGHGGFLDRLDSLVTASVATLAIGLIHSGYPNAARGTLVWQW